MCACRIVETDFNTKGMTRRKIDQMMDEAPELFERLAFRYLQKVYSAATREVPVDTGALRNSLRIQKGDKSAIEGEYVVGRKIPKFDLRLLAGGGGYINPKHRREVDYARAVHDGTASTLGNPFLDRAFMLTERDLDEFIDKYMNDAYLKKWMEDQPVPSTWSVSLPVSEYQKGLESIW